MSPASQALNLHRGMGPTAGAVGHWYGVGFADWSPPSRSGYRPELLLDLLQNPVGVIPGDEGDVFVDLQLVQ
jgi:hypothetical protein